MLCDADRHPKQCWHSACDTCILCPQPFFATQLNSLGVIKAFADGVGGMLASLNMGWMPLFGLLHFAFFTIHYW